MPPSGRGDALASLGTVLLLATLVVLPFAGFTWLGGVQFAKPLGFGLAIVAVPLLLLYMLKASRPRRRVASLLFWQPIALDQQASSPFKRLRRNLVLLLQLLALAGLVYGFARPVVQAGASDGTSLVVVIDTSASMLTVDVEGATRFEAARAGALDLVRSLGPRDQATVIAVDRAARTVVPWTRDEAALERGLAKLQPRHAETALAEGFILAASARRAATGDPEFHLFSDGGGPPPPPMTLGGPLVYHPVGSTGENLGIVTIDARPRVGPVEEGMAGDSDGLAYEIFATVLNAGAARREVFVGVEREGSILAARRMTVPADTEQSVVLDARLPPGPITVRLLPTTAGAAVDAFPVDDAAYALIPEDRGVAVGLISAQASPALERAIKAAGGSLKLIAPEAFTDDPELRLYVFEGVVPTTLPPRDCLFVSPQEPVGPIRPGPALKGLHPAGWDRQDSALRFVDFTGLEVFEATPLLLGGGARVLLQGETAAGEPAVLLAAWEDGSASRVIVGFDLYRSSWPLRASFPIFVRNCLLEASRRDRLARGGASAGVSLPIPVGADVKRVEIESPDGRLEQVSAWAGHAYFGGTRLAGVYTARAGERSERFCVNLTNSEESRIAPKMTYKVGAEEATQAPPPTRPTEVARWFAMLALVLLVVEFWVYHRRLE